MTRTLILGLGLLWFGCSDGDIGIQGPGGGGGGGGGCDDVDGDGYGRGCRLGDDCDDSDPSRSAGCEVEEFGGEDVPFSPDGANGVVIGEDGALSLGESVMTDDDTVWIANSDEGTVSKLDAPTGRELARYPSVIGGGNNARPWNEVCDFSSTGNCPSRTAIDFRRDCWVANRAFGHQGTVTKIASREEECIDRNGNGVIDTSHDSNVVGDDECVLFTVDVGGNNGLPRALAIAPDTRFISPGGNAWVGNNAERMAYEINGEDGAILRTVQLDINPYGALAGKVLGLVWFVNAGWQAAGNNPPGIQAVEFANGTVHPRQAVESSIGCTGTYGIAIDGQGRVWTGGYPCDAVFRYDGSPDTGTWMSVDIGGQGRTRGLVADEEDRIWVAHSTLNDRAVGNMSTIDGETGEVLAQYSLPTGRDTIGVDLDREGKIWTVSRETNNSAKFDPATGQFTEYPVGRGPYTYSDFTGHSLRLQFPQGTYNGVVEACGVAGADWMTVSWDAETPDGTAVSVRVRTAPTREGLQDAAWYGPWTESPADLLSAPGPVPVGTFLEFELSLQSFDGSATPRVTRIGVAYACALQ